MRQTPALQAPERMARIASARLAVLGGASGSAQALIEPWIERSWQRCLTQGQRPGDAVAFDTLPAQAMRRVAEAHHSLVRAARPVLEGLAHALSATGYFAILTNAEGVVIDAHGPIDPADRRASLITRIGVDLSERSVGTTAISAALTELQPVWLHRGEHFYADTSVYSCAGAPLIGPDGECVGMLDLTAVQATERPELRHLAAQSARRIENALTLSTCTKPGGLMVRLNWPGQGPASDNDGMLCLDADGWVTGANPAARHMLDMLRPPGMADGLHSNDLFALPYQMLFDAARQQTIQLDVPLWSGLRLAATPLKATAAAEGVLAAAAAPALQWAGMREALPLKDLETRLIKEAVDQARGNVAQAARALGISRATVYRKLGQGSRRGH